MNLLTKKFKNQNKDQEGMILVVALILMVILTAVGIAGIYLSTSDMKISNNYKQSVQEFYAVEAALNRGINVLKNTPINEWTNLIVDATGDLGPNNANASVILKENLGTTDEEALQNIKIGNMNYSVWVRNNFNDPSHNPSINSDTILVLFAEAVTKHGIKKRVESAVCWERIEDGSYSGKNMDSENSGSVEAYIDWDPNSP